MDKGVKNWGFIRHYKQWKISDIEKENRIKYKRIHRKEGFYSSKNIYSKN
jgi:hypothetical protein